MPNLRGLSQLKRPQLEAILAAEETREVRDARAKYAAAFAQMGAELPVVSEHGEILRSDGTANTYALWEDINEAIRPVLAKHGFALSFRTAQDGAAIGVTAVLTHMGGHREETGLRLPPDIGDSRNAVQAIGSSVSYGKRYTACALLNITTRGEDDDGRAAGGVISLDEVRELETAIAAARSSRKRFLRYLKIEALEHLPKARLAEARAALLAKAQNAGGAE